MSWSIEVDRKAGAKIMGDIHQLTPRKSRPCGNMAPSPADIIIFPGVRVERQGLLVGERINAAPAGSHANAEGLAWKDE